MLLCRKLNWFHLLQKTKENEIYIWTYFEKISMILIKNRYTILFDLVTIFFFLIYLIPFDQRSQNLFAQPYYRWLIIHGNQLRCICNMYGGSEKILYGKRKVQSSSDEYYRSVQTQAFAVKKVNCSLLYKNFTLIHLSRSICRNSSNLCSCV